MLSITCEGSLYEIGFQHGEAAAAQVSGSIDFYRGLFTRNCRKEWPEVCQLAQEFAENIKQQWPEFYQELSGIADGSKRQLQEIVAINVRTEISFGLFSDGCSSLYWKTHNQTFLGQNWDWEEEQKPNLILVTIKQKSKPVIKMVNEAGLLGKIGLNSAGVGVCFNAIRARGVQTSRLPAHLGLRIALESTSAEDAVAFLSKAGLASSANILVGDANNAIDCEFSSTTFKPIGVDPSGRIIHTNHLIAEHPDVDEPCWLPDSRQRLEQLHKLTDSFQGELSIDGFRSFFKDETNWPNSICRSQEQDSIAATLFNIVMDLQNKQAIVIEGRPNGEGKVHQLRFEE